MQRISIEPIIFKKSVRAFSEVYDDTAGGWRVLYFLDISESFTIQDAGWSVYRLFDYGDIIKEITRNEKWICQLFQFCSKPNSLNKRMFIWVTFRKKSSEMIF